MRSPEAPGERPCAHAERGGRPCGSAFIIALTYWRPRASLCFPCYVRAHRWVPVIHCVLVPLAGALLGVVLAMVTA